jgi:hypothetical protein
MNREKQDSAYDMLGFRVVHVLNNCLLRVMPPVEQHGKRKIGENSSVGLCA